MVGYVNIYQDELKVRDLKRYQGYYCGLCRSLKKRHGLVAQTTLTYDMTFLTILLSALYEKLPYESEHRCILPPFRKCKVLQNEFSDYAADMNLLLCYYDRLDDWRDDKDFTALFQLLFMRKQLKKIRWRYPRQAKAVQAYIKQLGECESRKDQNLDLAAGCTGRFLGEIFVYKEDEWSAVLRKMGFFLGKFIYLMDAYEDLEKDKKKGSYNPLVSFETQPDFDTMCESILNMMAAECAKAFEMLPILEEADLLRNILYAGIWSRYEEMKAKRNKSGKREP